jgi:hypothetical protein
MCASLLPVSEVAASSQLLHSLPARSGTAAYISFTLMCARVTLTGMWSVVAATSAAVSRPTASHPAPRHLCSRFVSASSIYRRFSTVYRMYADASDHRVRRFYTDTLASEPPLHTYCGTCMEIRWRVILLQFPLTPERRKKRRLQRRKKRRLQQFPPPSTWLRARRQRAKEAMAKT